MGSARRGETDEPGGADDRRSAIVLAELGPTGSLAGEAWGHITRVGCARCTARRSFAHLGFGGRAGSAACSRGRSGSTSYLGISGGSSRAGAELGRGRTAFATRRGCTNMGRAAAIDFPADWPHRACAVVGRAGGACAFMGCAGSGAPGPAAVSARSTNAQRALVEPARSSVGGTEARSLCARCSRLHRLGRTDARRRRATAHRRTVMGDAGCVGSVQVTVARME